MKISCSPQTKCVQHSTTKRRLRSASPITPLTGARWSNGGPRRSTRPVIIAAGTIATASSTNRTPPHRQSHAPSSACRTGASTSVPTEEKAPTMPRITLRRSGEAARAVAVIASDDPVQAMPMPIKVCANTNVHRPVVAARAAIAPTYASAPSAMTGRNPQRSATAPSGACARPQTMFCTAIAKVKSDADMASACVIGGRKSPRHWRMPIARLIITEAAMRIGNAFTRDATVMTGTFPLLCQPARIEPRVNSRSRDTPLHWQHAPVARYFSPLRSLPAHRPSGAARIGRAAEPASAEVGGDGADAGGLQRQVGEPIRLVAEGAERIARRLADRLLEVEAAGIIRVRLEAVGEVAGHKARRLDRLLDV